MGNVAATLACVDFFDRTRPVLDGSVETPGLDLTRVPLPPKELAVRWSEFDVAEVIVPIFMSRLAHGDDSYVGIPVFPYRAYFFSNVIVHADSGIERPADLIGRRVGTPGLHLAGTVWTRGILQDEYDVQGSQVHWVTPGPLRVTVPPEMPLEIISAERSLSDLLECGEIDAWLGSNTPACFERGSPRVRRLFPDYRAAEEAYARRTRCFPIIHMIALRRALYERDPWLATTLVQIFERAKAVGLARLVNDAVFACRLPWLRHDLEELPRLFGGDWYPYGFESNRDVLATLARYAAEQGLTPAPIDVAGLFAPETRS